MKTNKARSSWQLTFNHAISGFTHIMRTEKNMRIHCILSAAAIFLLIVFAAPIYEWAIIILVIGMVISAEILNTAIEIMVDIYCPYYHPLAKISKDVGAASVLFSAFIAVVIGCLIFIPHIINLF
jgi:diacylglycerol kinase